jgi:hypothetical protein
MKSAVFENPESTSVDRSFWSWIMFLLGVALIVWSCFNIVQKLKAKMTGTDADTAANISSVVGEPRESIALDSNQVQLFQTSTAGTTTIGTSAPNIAVYSANAVA